LRTYKPKKDVLIVSVKGRKSLDTIRDACRLHIFALAERMFPARFADLKKRALPLYVLAEKDASAIAALDMEIARWARTLDLVKYPPDLPGWALPRRDLWLRELAANRLRAWREGEPGTENFLIGGVRPNAEPRRSNLMPGREADETPAAWRKRIVRAKLNSSRSVPEWERILRFEEHFRWFVKHRVGKTLLKSLARDGQTLQAVAQAIRAVAGIIDPE
jgi:hypothetical protein